jgi:hypothetical protein
MARLLIRASARPDAPTWCSTRLSWPAGVRAIQVLQYDVSEGMSAAKSVEPARRFIWVARTPAGHDK